MDGNFFSELVHLVLRWIHVVAGVLWIGHLYFFNFVNAHVAKTYDADSKKKVVPELMPRALYWFRWGAAYTWVTGFLLIGFVYYMGSLMVDDPSKPKGMAIGVSFLVSFLVGPALYDTLWKRVFKGKEEMGVIVSSVVLAAIVFGLSTLIPGRALYIHIGSMFGTSMAMNVWMRIWPSQKKIIGAIKGGTAPDADVVATAGLRSKHNTYMSVPLLFLMISNHFPTAFAFAPTGTDLGWAVLLVLIFAGWGVTKLIYTKSAKPETASIG